MVQNTDLLIFILGKMGMALAHFVKILTWPQARGVKILVGPKKGRLRKILTGPEIQNTGEGQGKRPSKYLRFSVLVGSKTKILMEPSAQNTDGPARKILMGPIFKILTESKY